MATPQQSDATIAPPPEKQFRGWLLLGVLSAVMVVVALVSAAVDLWVIPR